MAFNLLRRIAARPEPTPAQTPEPEPVAIAQPAPNPYLNFETRLPSAQTAIDIFRGRWASNLEPLINVTGTGEALLFTHDKRPQQAADSLGKGSFEGMNVLELGPLEAAHTYLLEKLGAKSVTAVEASSEAFLKCLIVKEVLDLSRSNFLYGDAIEYLRSNTRKFDLVFCSGILYHMPNPIELIELVCKSADKCFIWTHYYSPARHPVPFEPREITVSGFTATHWSHIYGDRSAGFWGGNQDGSSWIEKEALLEAFRHFGLKNVTVIEDMPDHPNGPSITFAASRT